MASSRPQCDTHSSGAHSDWRFFDRGLYRAFRDGLLITLATALVALGVNVVHPRRIPFVAAKPYEILVPCPEPGGPVKALAATEPRVRDARSFRVDARMKEDFAKWHLPGAMNVPFDYLDPTPKKQLRALAAAAARSKAIRVVVYGDGDDPDSGEQLGKEISGSGIKNVFYVRGGAKALRGAATTGGRK